MVSGIRASETVNIPSSPPWRVFFDNIGGTIMKGFVKLNKEEMEKIIAAGDESLKHLLKYGIKPAIDSGSGTTSVIVDDD
jgi:hypothetical protein